MLGIFRRENEPASSTQVLFKFATGCGDVIGIENGRNDADTLCAGSKDFSDVVEIYAADGEPGNRYVCGRPSNVIQSDRLSAGFCASGVDWADGDVIGAGGDRFLSLFRGVSAQADLKSLDSAWNVRALRFTEL